MAIFPTLPGIEVTIQVNDQPLLEYTDENMDEILGTQAAHLADKTVSKYVESITDAEFIVQMVLEPSFRPTSPSLSFEVYVDGRWVSGKVIQTAEQKLKTRQIRQVVGAATWNPETKQGRVHHFKFANIKTTSDDQKLGEGDIKTEIKRMSTVGMIQVKVFRASLPISVPKQERKLALESDSSEVHEKALKGQAKSHGVVHGRSSATSSSLTHFLVDRLDGKQSPIANFVFQYRSKEALQQLHIIERTPEPEDLRNSPDVKPVVQKVKRERNDSTRNKSERFAKRHRYNTTIDLTGDSSGDEDDVRDVIVLE